MKLTPTVLAGLIIGCTVMPGAAAQTPAGLDIEDYAGLTITGTVGTEYSVEYVTDLAQTNDWRPLEFLRLPANPYLWTDKSSPVVGKRFYRAVAMEAPTNMVFVPPGTFRMGSPENEGGRWEAEGPQTDVIISRGFWMGKYEVTQEEYLALMGENPSTFNGVKDWPTPAIDYGTDLRRPVESVSWIDATNYCAALTVREQAAGRIRPNSVYRLPTEAEWEYACRGWTSTRFSHGDDAGYTNLADHAWSYENSGARTHAVGQKLPNSWGLHDMHGNVYEFCQDGWSDELPGGMALDPLAPSPAPPQLDRVVRGGSLLTDARDCRSAARSKLPNSVVMPSVGFRVVLAPSQP